MTGDPLADLVLLADGAPPQVSRNLGNGEHWLAVDLGGRWKTSFDHMRTNPHGLGTAGDAGRAGAPRHLRAHHADRRPVAVDRADRARAGQGAFGRVGPPSLARRRRCSAS